LADELKLLKKMSMADFGRSTGEAEKGGNIHRRFRVQDGGARNQSHLFLGASCGSNKYAIRNHDPLGFLIGTTDTARTSLKNDAPVRYSTQALTTPQTP
jgi:hypothetical protein